MVVVVWRVRRVWFVDEGWGLARMGVDYVTCNLQMSYVRSAILSLDVSSLLDITITIHPVHSSVTFAKDYP
jgi:hypothetical protein